MSTDALEVTVLEGSRLPKSGRPVLAVQVGRQAPIRQAGFEVGQTFMVPLLDEHRWRPTVEISVFSRLAEGMLPDGTVEKNCELNVRLPDGSNKEVTLYVERTGGGDDDLRKVKGKAEAAASHLGGYAERQLLGDHVRRLLEEVLREQPEDPYRYMLERLKVTKGALAHQGPSPEEAVDFPEIPEGMPLPAAVVRMALERAADAMLQGDGEDSSLSPSQLSRMMTYRSVSQSPPPHGGADSPAPPL
eukprot:TRINITY_DN10424_c0_g1_i3.p1 TRINITY_DN10424_c0_g1~~TRINITY_DN10424_c0_g1_i3.p1  ORF type:complete len:246 (+),score=65.41 TRINITY_DN10424_c0_g1_i3:143-880(+)